MISATRRWLRRNRTGIAIGAGVVGATYLAGQYVLGKIQEARERMQMDRIAKENIQRRFEQNQTDCTITVLALLPTLTENVLEELPVEQLTHELQQKKAERLARASGEGRSEASSLHDGDTVSMSSFQTGSFMHTSQIPGDGSQPSPRRTKAQLWNELKITSITRAFTLIYSLSLLMILTRIQLNLLGRLNYLSSVISLTQPLPPGRANSISLEDHDDASMGAGVGNDFETNRRYLTFSWFLLHRGYAQIMSKVRSAVREVFGSISPNEGVSATRLSELVLAVRRRVEGSSEQERYATRWLPYILPPREEEETVLIESGVITPSPSSPGQASQEEAGLGHNSSVNIDTSSGPLRQLLDETADLIDSPIFTRIHTLLLGSMFSRLVDAHVIAQTFAQPPQQSLYASSQTPQHPRIQELDSSVTVVPGEPRVKLASLLAIVTRQAHAIGNGNNPPNEYISTAESEVKELEAFAALIYASNLEEKLEENRASSESGLKASSGMGVSEVGTQNVDEMIESKLESAWTKVSRTSFSSR
ncbi:Peroxin-3 [Exophiala viscosa]|uniref:Peroxin-3 n=1 Tax=Exophiala viscosa TaxID=2486360 RepID=A0AAN6E4F3_9EURO|nr:Peroxin-3 [Exophiala viscosa]